MGESYFGRVSKRKTVRVSRSRPRCSAGNVGTGGLCIAINLATRESTILLEFVESYEA
jgi:hypothetical protein